MELNKFKRTSKLYSDKDYIEGLKRGEISESYSYISFFSPPRLYRQENGHQTCRQENPK